MPRVLLSAVLLAGCVSTQPAPLTSFEGRAEVNARAAGRVAVVRVQGGRGGEVRGLRVGPDSTTWVDRRDGRARSVPTADVAAVTFRRGRVLRGLTIGVAAGAVLGLIASTEDEGSGWLGPLPAWFWVMAGAADGALVGSIVGVAATQNDVYRPASPETAAACGGPPLACAAPPGAGGGAAPAD